jgi:serine/threonine protein kinase
MDDVFVSDDVEGEGCSGGGCGCKEGGGGCGCKEGGGGCGCKEGGGNNIIFYDKDRNNLSLTCDVGSSIYRAPELEREYKYYNNKIDVYSLGIIFIEMLLINYNTQHEKYKYITAIINNRKKPLPYLITNNYDDIIINMICKNHNKRISINDITIIYKDNKKVYCDVYN